jgi:hypothetical protein
MIGTCKRIEEAPIYSKTRSTVDGIVCDLLPKNWYSFWGDLRMAEF